MNPEFRLRYPRVVRFGWGTVAELPDILRGIAGPAPRAFVVSTRSGIRNGLQQRLLDLCGDCVCGTGTEAVAD